MRRACCPQPRAEDEFSGADPDKASEERDRSRDPDALEGVVALRWEAHELPYITLLAK